MILNRLEGDQELIRLVHFFQHEFLSVVHECLIMLKENIERLKRWVHTLGSTVSKTSGLVRPGGLGCPVDTVELAVLPAPHSQQEAHDITLLLPVQLLHVLIGSHLDLLNEFKNNTSLGHENSFSIKCSSQCCTFKVGMKFKMVRIRNLLEEMKL